MPDQTGPAHTQVDPHQVAGLCQQPAEVWQPQRQRILDSHRDTVEAQPSRQQQATCQVTAAGHQRHLRKFGTVCSRLQKTARVAEVFQRIDRILFQFDPDPLRQTMLQQSRLARSRFGALSIAATTRQRQMISPSCLHQDKRTLQALTVVMLRLVVFQTSPEHQRYASIEAATTGCVPRRGTRG